MHNNIRKGFPSSDRPQDRKRHRTFSVVAAAALGAMTLASCSPSSALSPDTVVLPPPSPTRFNAPSTRW